MNVRAANLRKIRNGQHLSAFELLCAVLEPSIGDDLQRSLADAVETLSFRWTEFADLATDQLVAPTVAHRLDQNGLTERLPDAVSRYFAAVYRLNRIRNTQIDLECMAIAAALNDIGVVPVFFKGGGAMLAGLYALPSSR